jgi:ABC-2 type transport system ATP-binding protein
MHNPELVILDEPANGLDPAGLVEIRELLRSLTQEKGVTVFMSSHILTEVDRLATRIGIINQGRLIEELDTDKLEKLRSKHLEVQARNLESAFASLHKLGYKPEMKENMFVVEDARAIERPDEVAQILVNAGTPPTRLLVKQQNLEEHFMQLTGGVK